MKYGNTKHKKHYAKKHPLNKTDKFVYQSKLIVLKYFIIYIKTVQGVHKVLHTFQNVIAK